jgi:hypothetical protein
MNIFRKLFGAKAKSTPEPTPSIATASGPAPEKKTFASCVTRSDLFQLGEEVKCRCYYSLEDLAESFHALSRIYSGRIETRKTTNGGSMCPYLLIIESCGNADQAALQIDKQFGAKWGDYHIMRPGKIYDQSKPLGR